MILLCKLMMFQMTNQQPYDIKIPGCDKQEVGAETPAVPV
jgi:hypothetical protein